MIFRAERDGFHLGHEQRLSTDLEYILPKDPRKPGGELFLILEMTFVHRGTGRLNGQAVDGSRVTEYYLAPGLQYAAHTRFVIEGSFQFPVLLNTGPLVLRTDRNIGSKAILFRIANTNINALVECFRIRVFY